MSLNRRLMLESAGADDLFERPAHPYTLGLLASVPSLDGDGGERLSVRAQVLFDGVDPCRLDERAAALTGAITAAR